MSTAPLQDLHDALRAIALSKKPIDCLEGGPLKLDTVMTLAMAKLVEGVADRSLQRTQLLETRVTVAGAEALARWSDLLASRTWPAKLQSAASSALSMVAGAVITLLAQWVGSLL